MDKKNIQPQGASAYNERRKKADLVTNMATVLSLFSWIAAFVVWVLLDIAAPEKENIFTRMLGAEIRSYWNTSLLPIAFALLILSFCICILAFFFNLLRKRRKTDQYKKSIILAGMITIFGIVLFVIKFGEILF